MSTRVLAALATLAASAFLLSPARAGVVSDPSPAPPLTAPGCRVPPAVLDAGSRALGRPHRGRLVNGVTYPDETPDSFTWDFPEQSWASPWWRRVGTQKLVLTVQCVLHRHALAHPGGARIGVADLSRPGGGFFGAIYGGLGHASHQNGLDVDVLYPRRDGAELPPDVPADVDVPAAQDLVDAFVRAGAQYVFVSPALRRRGLLTGPPKVVIPLVHHDDHLHVRIRP